MVIKISSKKRLVLFCAETAARRETLFDLMKEIEITSIQSKNWQDFLTKSEPYNITIAPLDQVILCSNLPFILISKFQLFSEQVCQHRLEKDKK
ncbi:hypothetical protein [Candidatus Coxiella mudrowiae]|uniref:hypothetical protein n=1 Tax=Candidatus Coxiella mudrowiae TaxID=2054173 RepID=UPI00069FA687|nr:hypothetical protein [Candidatus Coxiella mudrowiae]